MVMSIKCVLVGPIIVVSLYKCIVWLFYSINGISRPKLRKVDTIWIMHLTNEYTSTHLHKLFWHDRWCQLLIWQVVRITFHLDLTKSMN
jgi:hypothetical protein